MITDPPVVPPRSGITVELFLKKIGKDCAKYAPKFKSWEELMSFKTLELKKLEIAVSQRRWILHWVHKYKLGEDPFSIRFKSKARKNREIAKAKKEAHEANVLKGKLRKELKKQKEDEVTKKHYDELQKTLQDKGITFTPNPLPPQQAKPQRTTKYKKAKRKQKIPKEKLMI